MKLHDDYVLAHVPIKRANYQMALYTVHLATGNAVSCCAIKAATIETLSLTHF